MTTPTPGKTWVESAPPIEPYRYGLLSVATIQDGPGTWQANGVEYFTDACAQGGFVVGSCPTLLPGVEQTADVTFTPGAATGDGVTLTAPAGNDFTVLWALVPEAGGAPLTGTLAPGQTLPVDAPDGSWIPQAQYAGGPVVAGAAFDMPAGDPVTVTVTLAAGEGTTHDKPVTEGLNLVQGSVPFTVYARAECSAVGFEDPQAAARRRLALIENREVERFFSQYVLGAVGARLPLGNTAVGIKRALGVLEQDAALFYGGTPTLHAPRWTNPYWEDRNLLQPNQDTGPVRRTHLDARVAFGGGYYDVPSAAEPPPPDGDVFWLAATGSVRAFRSAVFVNETFTPATNLRLAIAERTYALDADCYRALVAVTLAGEG